MIARIPFSRSQISSDAAAALPSQSPGKINDTLVTGRSSEGGSRTWNLCQPEIGGLDQRGIRIAKAQQDASSSSCVGQAHLRYSSFESARRGGRYGCARTDARERAKRSTLHKGNVPPACLALLRCRGCDAQGAVLLKTTLAAFNLRFNCTRKRTDKRCCCAYCSR